jgi:hypothetical protein
MWTAVLLVCGIRMRVLIICRILSRISQKSDLDCSYCNLMYFLQWKFVYSCLHQQRTKLCCFQFSCSIRDLGKQERTASRSQNMVTCKYMISGYSAYVFHGRTFLLSVPWRETTQDNRGRDKIVYGTTGCVLWETKKWSLCPTWTKKMLKYLIHSTPICLYQEYGYRKST